MIKLPVMIMTNKRLNEDVKIKTAWTGMSQPPFCQKKNFPKMFSKESHKIFKYRRGWLAYPILFSILNHLSVALKSNG